MADAEQPALREPHPGDSTTNQWQLPRLRIDRDGAWLDGEVEITHPGVIANLRGNLQRDGNGYFIQTRVRIPVEVEDVPWIVTRIERRDDRLYGRLNDDTETEIDPSTLRVGAGDAPYCTVQEGRFEARLNLAAAFQLLALVEPDPRAGSDVLRLGWRTYPLQKTG
jgi:hypothetical protein